MEAVNRLKLERFYDPVAFLSALPVSLVVIVGSFLSYRSHAILRQNRDLVVHTYDVIESTQRILVAAADAETSQRGYVITGNPAFLEPLFRAAHATMPRELRNLEQLVQDNGRELERINQLKQLLDEKFQELDLAVQTRQHHGFEAARSLVANQSGKHIMDRIRRTLAEIGQTEQTLLSTRNREVARSEQQIIAVGIATAMVSTLARLLVAFWRQRVLRINKQHSQ